MKSEFFYPNSYALMSTISGHAQPTRADSFFFWKRDIMSEDNSSPPPFSETQMRWLNRFLPTQPPADPPTTSHQAAGERGVRKLGGREMGSVGPIAASHRTRSLLQGSA